MTKTLATLVFLAMAATAAGCGDDTAAPAPPTTTAPTAPSTPPVSLTLAAPAASGLRGQSCRDMLSLLDELRALSPDAARSTAETTITNLSSTPEWSTLSEADRAATIAGIRDAAEGTCR